MILKVLGGGGGGGQPRDIRVMHRSRQPRRGGSDSRGCEAASCSHLCLIKRDGRACACPDVMKLSADGETCVDVEAMLLVAGDDDDGIRGIVLDDDIRNTDVPIARSANAAAMDFDAAAKRIFWLDETDIKAAQIGGSAAAAKSVLDGRALSQTRAFAVDWVGKNVYFSSEARRTTHRPNSNHLKASSATSSIFVSNFRGELTSTVIDRSPGLVSGLAVAPKIGMMYWSDDDDVSEVGATVKIPSHNSS